MEQDSKTLWLNVHSQIPQTSISLGKATSAAYFSDPKMLGFIFSRYKFVAKMLENVEAAIEVGCGDGLGAPVVAEALQERLICTDIDEDTLADNARRLEKFDKISFSYHDFRTEPYPEKVDAIYSVDVIEHIYKKEEASLMSNLLLSLKDTGVMIFGTPNIFGSQYASKFSNEGHVNLKDHVGFRSALKEYFHNVFMFSMNDEVLHTGYYKMAHYIWAVCAAPRKSV